jgi:hypothetical protein
VVILNPADHVIEFPLGKLATGIGLISSIILCVLHAFLAPDNLRRKASSDIAAPGNGDVK